MLCITVEVEHRIEKKEKKKKKKTAGKGMEGGKKVFCVVFWLTRRSRVRRRKMRFGASYSTSNKLLLIARRIMNTGLQKCL